MNPFPGIYIEDCLHLAICGFVGPYSLFLWPWARHSRNQGTRRIGIEINSVSAQDDHLFFSCGVAMHFWIVYTLLYLFWNSNVNLMKIDSIPGILSALGSFYGSRLPGITETESCCGRAWAIYNSVSTCCAILIPTRDQFTSIGHLFSLQATPPNPVYQYCSLDV